MENPTVQTSFLGLPLFVWGLICLGVALIWAFFWPAQRAVGATGLRLFLMRWGHSLVWLLLAVMCFLRGSGLPSLAGWSGAVGLTSLAVYAAFVAATIVLK